MKDIRKYFVILAFVLSCFSIGCINLKEFHEYSSNSVKSLKKFEETGYSFNRACDEKCFIEQLEKQKLSKIACNCIGEKTADSITLLIYQAIKGYFEGLSRLSANELTNYKFNPLAKALKEGEFDDLRIKKEHVDAYAKIANILSRSITDTYRKKKIAIYVGEANEPVKKLLEALEFILSSNLSKRLETQKQRIESYYFDLSIDNSSSVYEKKKIIEEYMNATESLEARKKLITSYGKSLRSIAKAHQELFENRNKLKARDFKDMLIQYASDIQDLEDEFNKLKNE